MQAIFLDTLNRYRGQIIGWGIAIALLGAILVPFYDIIRDQSEQFEQLLELYPEGFMAAFGLDDMAEFLTPAGFLSAELFSYLPLVLGVFAVLAGSGLIVSDEENGTLDLLMAYPVSRTTIFIARLLAFLVATDLILVIAWLGLVIPAATSGFELTALELAMPFFSLYAVLVLFAMLALLLSLLLPSRRLAATVAGLLLVLSFFAITFAALDETWEGIARFSPLNYYQSGDAINGMNWSWLAGLFAVAALLALASWWRFNVRDVRIGGEGGWGFVLPWRRSTRQV